MENYYVGIDAGSTYVKVAVMDDEGRLAGYDHKPTGINADGTAREMMGLITITNGIPAEKIRGIMATGYSRRNIETNHGKVTEIKAHAMGARWSAPEGVNIRTVIDIGGQDSKVIVLDQDNDLTRFAMNDKCAAGTGRFLESLARVLELEIGELGQLSLQAEIPSQINSTCVVFAESEVISLLARKKRREDIVAGIHQSLARRIAGMARKAEAAPEILLTGGGGLNIGIADALEEEMLTEIYVPDHPQLNGAIGAALMARNGG